MIIAQHATGLGALTLVSDGAGLAGLYFENHKVGGPPADAREGSDKIIDATRKQLDEYFAGKRRSFDLPLAPKGAAVQMRVWEALKAIEFGTLKTYGALAAELGMPKAARATGTAIGRNPVSIVIPCHRVIGASGALTGYAGGVERKKALLAFERGEAPIRCI